MAFMIYDERNRNMISKLADNTKAQALKWYQYCIDKKVQVLIYDTIRTKAQQAENVKKGVSKTMKSYHIVGQALDFVFVDSKGKPMWSLSSYTSKMDIINYARKLGFIWGADWDNDGNWRDETFLDSPHLQYNYKGYGTDTFGKSVGGSNPVNSDKEINKKDDVIREIQMAMNSRYNLKIETDGYYGEKTREALLIGLKIEFNTHYTREMGRRINTLDGRFSKELEALFSKVVLSENSKTK